MSQIHYFQRYSQKENVDTNNTLLLLSRIQAEDPRLLRAVLLALFSEEGSEAPEIEVGVRFEEQTKAMSGSIPDGRLRQSSLLIVVETKRKPSFKLAQIEAHLAAFSNETTRIMLLLA